MGWLLRGNSMTTGQKIAEGLLWLAALFMGILVGGSVYQRMSLIPYWAGDLPGSLVRYFHDPAVAQSIGAFWTRILIPVGLSLVLTLIANWRMRGRRLWIGVALGCFLVALVWTGIYFVPKGVIPLFEKDGAGLSGDQITAMARMWINLDWIRMGLTVVAFFALMRATALRVASA